ncbi:hypothetical protein [Mucilaginibacter sp.]|uniref:hypothetical protein n=1 Tax=Mucilaginibacter sp. TaxID=1882438 RepID=UPI0025F07F9F|nr:hypothetical protein [Mucilaginibacter sp.]
MDIRFDQVQNPISLQQVSVCCKKIAEQVGDKPISDWTNSDYIKLSGLLLRKTKVHLSENTLKRIFRKQKTSDYYYPQKATRDALAQFVGYRDWYEFELVNPVENNKGPLAGVTITSPKIVVAKTINKGWLYVPLFIIGIGIAFFIIQGFDKGSIEVKNVALQCLNPVGQTPHSAFFKLDVKGILPDSASKFCIDFGDEKLKRKSFNDSLISHYYEVPGRYYPQLYYKNKPIDTAYVYLQTKGWTATASLWNDTTRVYPVLDPDLAQSKALNISAAQVFKSGIDTNRTFFIHYANIKPTHINGDDFELSVNITSSKSRPGVRCSETHISIFGENDKHYLGIIKPECAVWNVYQFSEKHKDGEKDDLRALGYDLSAGAVVTVHVENKKVTLLINSKEVFKTKYTQPIGKIMGVKVSFAGIGHFENLKITDLKTGEVF